jgi:hypothetical protein
MTPCIAWDGAAPFPTRPTHEKDACIQNTALYLVKHAKHMGFRLVGLAFNGLLWSIPVLYPLPRNPPYL